MTDKEVSRLWKSLGKDVRASDSSQISERISGILVFAETGPLGSDIVEFTHVDDVSHINERLADTSVSRFVFKAGVFVSASNSDPITINRSNIFVEFEEGVVIQRRDPHCVKTPLLVIGDFMNYGSGNFSRISNVVLRGVGGLERWTVDGCCSADIASGMSQVAWSPQWSLVNGISVRGVDGLYIGNLTATRAAHAGLEIQDCRSVVLENSTFTEARFQGLCFSRSSDLWLHRIVVDTNRDSGIKWMSHNSDVLMTESRITRNATTGLSVVCARNFCVMNCSICDNLSHGLYVAGDVSSFVVVHSVIETNGFNHVERLRGFGVFCNVDCSASIHVIDCDIQDNSLGTVRRKRETPFTEPLLCL